MKLKNNGLSQSELVEVQIGFFHKNRLLDSFGMDTSIKDVRSFDNFELFESVGDLFLCEAAKVKSDDNSDAMTYSIAIKTFFLGKRKIQKTVFKLHKSEIIRIDNKDWLEKTWVKRRQYGRIIMTHVFEKCFEIAFAMTIPVMDEEKDALWSGEEAVKRAWLWGIDNYDDRCALADYRESSTPSFSY